MESVKDYVAQQGEWGAEEKKGRNAQVLGSNPSIVKHEGYECWGGIESWIAFIVIIIFVIVATVLQAYFMKGV